MREGCCFIHPSRCARTGQMEVRYLAEEGGRREGIGHSLALGATLKPDTRQVTSRMVTAADSWLIAGIGGGKAGPLDCSQSMSASLEYPSQPEARGTCLGRNNSQRR